MSPRAPGWFRRISRHATGRRRLLCFPYAGAGASVFAPWNEVLPADLELWAVQLPGRENRLTEAPLGRVDDVVRALVPEVAAWMTKPTVFFGHSLGSLVAYELTRALQRGGHPLPTRLVVAGMKAPDRVVPDARPIDDAELLEALRAMGGTPPEVLEDAELLELVLPAVRADFTMAQRYAAHDAAPVTVPLTAFGGADDPEVSEPDVAAWRAATCGDFHYEMVEGGHLFLHRWAAHIVARSSAS